MLSSPNLCIDTRSCHQSRSDIIFLQLLPQFRYQVNTLFFHLFYFQTQFPHHLHSRYIIRICCEEVELYTIWGRMNNILQYTPPYPTTDYPNSAISERNFGTKPYLNACIDSGLSERNFPDHSLEVGYGGVHCIYQFISVEQLITMIKRATKISSWTGQY